MKILHQLEQPDFRPSKSDRILIHYLKENAAEFCTSPIAVLADRCGISEATITRFVRKMGFDGLQLFKLALAEEIANTKKCCAIEGNIACSEDITITAGKLLACNITALEHTVNNLDERMIAKSASLLKQADRVFFAGLGNSGFVAHDLAYKFMRIGINAKGLDNSHLIMLNMALVNKNNVVVALSHSGESYEMLEAVGMARKNGASIIAITANRSSQLREWADVSIFYENSEPMLESETVPSKLAQMFIMDLLYTEVVKQTMEMASSFRQKTEDAINTVRLNSGY